MTDASKQNNAGPLGGPVITSRIKYKKAESPLSNDVTKFRKYSLKSLNVAGF